MYWVTVGYRKPLLSQPEVLFASPNPNISCYLLFVVYGLERRKPSSGTTCFIMPLSGFCTINLFVFKAVHYRLIAPLLPVSQNAILGLELDLCDFVRVWKLFVGLVLCMTCTSLWSVRCILFIWVFPHTSSSNSSHPWLPVLSIQLKHSYSFLLIALFLKNKKKRIEYY